MTEVQSTTQEIIALLEQALVANEASPPLSPAEKERIRREQDEYDYDPPGYDPDEPTGDDPYYPDDEDEEVVDAYLDEIEAAYEADPDADSDQDVAAEDLMVPVEPPPSPMIVSVLQENLKKALDLVVRYIPSYPPLPVLGNVLLEAEDSRLKISATDLESSISVWIGARREQPGAITIPAKTMKKYIALLSPERIDFRVDVSTWIMNVRCGIQTGELRGIDANEFPPIRHNENRCDFTIVAEALLRMLDTVIKGVAKEQNRPILSFNEPIR
ncbi:MAG: hypothetical protein OXG68_02350 [Chloroflexi bacterium]|nr:hypothetical protein [Chloroflexota bacterium]